MKGTVWDVVEMSYSTNIVANARNERKDNCTLQKPSKSKWIDSSLEIADKD